MSAQRVSRVGRGSRSAMGIHQVALLARAFMGQVSLNEEVNGGRADRSEIQNACTIPTVTIDGKACTKRRSIV